MDLEQFQDVSIYLGSKEVLTSTRLEVAVKSPLLHSLLSSLKVCDGCREPVVLIFPAEDQDFNSLKKLFKGKGWSVLTSK